jgi:hypothetical protein
VHNLWIYIWKRSYLAVPTKDNNCFTQLQKNEELERKENHIEAFCNVKFC